MSWQFKEGNKASSLASRLKKAAAKDLVVPVPAHLEKRGFIGAAKSRIASEASAAWLKSRTRKRCA